MAVTLRLTRIGAIKKPFFRVVAAEKSRARDGKFIEILGHYNPADYPNSVTLKEERIREWLEKGAQPSEAVKKLLSLKGILKKNGKAARSEVEGGVPVERPADVPNESDS